ncbi:LD-carboxypeptidase [Sphingobacterium sp. JB170]|uniref:S66 peptidase family protein n=1 Tax=Sphingobacterium sp. JB170 TaxID=1434842 RepID=UPI00097F302D|nr:LD-carboxypeptidase [Sphingobacterium sp. JB170]SJN48486.1 Muramoyltetrapeptide carboxypeptidase [Sphingobacterium sp. JB170]
MNKRHFLKSFGLGVVSLGFWSNESRAVPLALKRTLKPATLNVGDCIGIIAPAGALDSERSILVTKELLEKLGFRVKEGEHIRSRYGNLAGTDEERLADIHQMFADPQVQGVVCIRGGTGVSRLLDRIDYSLIAKNPKVILGYSDITGLILALYTKIGLVSFHGAVGTSTWSSQLVEKFEEQFFENKLQKFVNPAKKGDTFIQYNDRIRTIHEGRVEGVLLGGNLTLVSGLCGSAFLPDFKDAILFIEEVDEDYGRVDRMFCQLKNAGILAAIKGFVFGNCTDCSPTSGYGSFNLDQILDDYIRPLNIPSYSGARIGHISDQFILPVGVTVRMDATAGIIELLEPALN